MRSSYPEEALEHACMSDLKGAYAELAMQLMPFRHDTRSAFVFTRPLHTACLEGLVLTKLTKLRPYRYTHSSTMTTRMTTPSL